MSRPDFERIKRNANVVFAGAGETALLRTFVSASAGSPQYGVGDSFNYTETIVTAMFAAALFGAPRPTEQAWPGGQTQMADLMMTTDRAIGARDEVVWRGTAYRIAGEAMPEHLGGHIMFRNPLKLASKV